MTLKTLSKELGLSITTVSDALKDNPTGYVAPATRERVQQAAARLGYRPNLHARRLVTQRATNVIGIYVSDLPSYELQLVKINTIQRTLAEEGYELNLVTGGPDAFVRLARQNPTGIILFNWLSEKNPTEEAIRAYLHPETHLVALDVFTPLPRHHDHVLFDRRDNTRRATQHLLELGHRHLGVFLDPQHLPQGERSQGLHDALTAFGLGSEATTFYKVGNVAGYETGQSIAEQWLATPHRPTGMVLLNDETSAGFITHVQAAGVRVPHDVSVIGHDNRSWSPHLNVPLTTVSHPAAKIAQTAAEMLLQRINGTLTGPAQTITIGSELILRASTAPPSGGA